MPVDRPASAGARGPVRREPVLAASGYRIDERRRFELQAAALFTDANGLQGVIDLAVTEFLERMRDVPGFADTLTNAEKHQQLRAGIRRMPDVPSRPEGRASESSPTPSQAAPSTIAAPRRDDDL